MLLRGLLSPALTCLAVGALSTAHDPFVGKWKVDPARSRVSDEMQVQGLGGDKYVFTFGPGQVDTIVADGTDQPALQGTTLAVTRLGPNNWTVVRKKDGRKLLSAIWTLSADGKTLDDVFTGYPSEGAPVTTHFIYRRSANGAGFEGVWDSTSGGLDPSTELEIQPYAADGLSFVSRALPMDMKIELDGKDHATAAPDLPPGAALSGRRVSGRSLEITGRYQGRITGARHIEVSGDLKTLTMTVRLTGDKQPRYVLVFDREAAG